MDYDDKYYKNKQGLRGDYENNQSSSIKKPLFCVAVIKSKYYSNVEKIKACVSHAIKNKILTHDVRIFINIPSNRDNWQSADIELMKLENFEFFRSYLLDSSLMDDTKECLTTANAVITFDSTEHKTSELVNYAENFALRHKLPMKNYD